MRYLVTGAAGFIGSHLVEALLDEGHEVVGIDAFSNYYPRVLKERNLSPALRSDKFICIEGDLCSIELGSVINGVDGIFHLAGQPGVRESWAAGFNQYLHDNILATQRLLEACRGKIIQRFVYASSSSIYGNAETWPTSESTLPQPHSPYGVTKLGAEHLCGLYARNYGVPTVSLRYFTVYGPRQRPDMAIGRIIRSGLQGEPFKLMGDGHKVRDFTYVGDIVSANMAALTADVMPGSVFNIAGGSHCSMRELLLTLSNVCDIKPPVEYVADALGDVDRTHGDIALASSVLGWRPVVPLEEGLLRHAHWIREDLAQ